MSTIFPSRIVRWLPILLLCSVLQVPWSVAHAETLPSLAQYGVKQSELLFPEKVQGKVSSFLQGGQFVMNEKKHLVCRETEINAQPAMEAKVRIVPGTKVSITRYRLKNKSYFVSSMTILSR